MTAIRPAAVAGQFYPDQPEQLAAMVRGFLESASARQDAAPKAIIAPHAGYVYSGALAGEAYGRLKPHANQIKRVILLGPCHRVAVRGLAAPSNDAFATPLGTIPIDDEARQIALKLPQVTVFDDTHAQEHSLEVHLPFLQLLLGDFTLLPLVVGEAAPEVVADVLAALWGGPETLIVISSDLSHFLDYDAARAIDTATCRAIEALDPAAIGHDQACGRMPIGGILEMAKRRDLKVETIGMCTSGDTAGPKDRVVGYGAWAFLEPEADTEVEPDIEAAATPEIATTPNFEAETKALLDAHGDKLLRVAGRSIRNGLSAGKPMNVTLDTYPDALQQPGACFVTLKTDGRLRGCIGTPEAHRPLVTDVAENAFRSAFRDPRFPPLTEAEVETLTLSISVLSPPEPFPVTDEADLLAKLRPGIDGLIIADGPKRALFLPSVWSQLPKPEQFLSHLKQKAGMSTDHWSDRFTAQRFIAGEIKADNLPK